MGLAAALMMGYAGVLTAVRTPFVRESAAISAGGAPRADVRGGSTLGFIGRCALRLGLATAVALPLLVRLTEVSVDASLAVFGFDAFAAGIELRGQAAMALVLGALWGAGAGAAGALLACATRAAGLRASPLAWGEAGGGGVAAAECYETSASASGPYTPGAPYRPPNPDTNPYLRLPDELRRPQGPPGTREPRPGASGGPGGAGSPGGPGGSGARAPDANGAPTVVRRFTPPPRRPGQAPGTGAGSGAGAGAWPAPPPPPEAGPPPPPPPRGPRGR